MVHRRMIVQAGVTALVVASAGTAGPCGPGAGDCCIDNGTPGCDGVDCCNVVCGVDPFCCDVVWDGICADEAWALCSDLCTGDPNICGPGAGDCCMANETLGCEDAACCRAVCAMDVFCCTVTWDAICAGEALEICDGCAGSCLPPHCPSGGLPEGETCGIDSSSGCNSVPPSFIRAACGETFCATAWATGGTRDTDWYLVDHPGGTLVGTTTSNLPTTCLVVDGIGSCAPVVVGAVGCSENGVPIAPASASLPPGQYVVFVAAGDCTGNGVFDGYPCGTGCEHYVLDIDCVQDNDHCQDAAPIDVAAGGSAGVAGTTIGATADTAPACGAAPVPTAPGVWYRVTGHGHTMTASTCGQADFDTRISVLCAECPTGPDSSCCFGNGGLGCDDPECEALVCGQDPFCCRVAWDGICGAMADDLCEVCHTDASAVCVTGGDDTAGCGNTTSVGWCASAGAEYLILVHGAGSQAGSFTLTVADDGVPCEPEVSCPIQCRCSNDDDCPPGYACLDCGCVPIQGCFTVLSEETTCQGDGSSFSWTVTGIDSCTGVESTQVFAAQGGAPGQEICFTLSLGGPGPGCPCVAELCTEVPDCTQPSGGAFGDLDGDGHVGAADLLALLGQWGPCGACNQCPDADGDCAVGVAEFLLLLAGWG